MPSASSTLSRPMRSRQGDPVRRCVKASVNRVASSTSRRMSVIRAGVGLGAQPPASLRVRPEEAGRSRRAVAAQDVDGFGARAGPRATPRCRACAAGAACSAGSDCSPRGRWSNGSAAAVFASAGSPGDQVSETLPSGSVRGHLPRPAPDNTGPIKAKAQKELPLIAIHTTDTDGADPERFPLVSPGVQGRDQSAAAATRAPRTEHHPAFRQWRQARRPECSGQFSRPCSGSRPDSRHIPDRAGRGQAAASMAGLPRGRSAGPLRDGSATVRACGSRPGAR